VDRLAGLPDTLQTDTLEAALARMAKIREQIIASTRKRASRLCCNESVFALSLAYFKRGPKSAHEARNPHSPRRRDPHPRIVRFNQARARAAER
jgi:hypothetical protein